MKRASVLILLISAVMPLVPLPARADESEFEIRVIYDNTSAREDVPADWGFSSVVTFRGRRVLFDSGTKPDLFLENLAKMDVPVSSIEQAVISHQHPDHRNGIYALYPQNKALKVHFLKAFYDKAWKEAAAAGLEPNRVTEPFEVVPGVYSTGHLEGDPPEQSLVIETSEGVVLLVGCSHPGIVNIVKKVKKQRSKDEIRLVLGGFHMFRQSEEQIHSQIEELQALKVKKVMPGHCTGDLAKQLFEQAYGDDFEALGAGKIIVLE